MIHPSKLALAQLWLSDHNALVVLATVTAVLTVGAGAFYLPLGPQVHLVGTVVRAGYVSGKYGSHYVAYVETDGQMVSVRPFFGRSCTAGSPIGLERQRRIWGYAFIADEPACEAGIPSGVG